MPFAVLGPILFEALGSPETFESKRGWTFAEHKTVNHSADEYVEIALRLGRDAEYRKSVSEQISGRCARLFDRPDAALALGDELLRIAGTAR